MPEITLLSNNGLHKTERWTSQVLRISVWISACLMIIGLLIAEIFPGSIEKFSGNPSIIELAHRILTFSFDPVTIMFAGIILLMFTPVFRVVTALAGFFAERDWKFVLVSAIVLVLLAGEIVFSIYVK